MRQKQQVPGTFRIGLVGVGYVGQPLMEALEASGHDVTGIDVKMTRKGVKLLGEGKAFLREADMVVVLTPRGSDFEPYVGDLRSDGVVIDDTHPRIRNKLNGKMHFKVAVSMRGGIYSSPSRVSV